MHWANKKHRVEKLKLVYLCFVWSGHLLLIFLLLLILLLVFLVAGRAQFLVISFNNLPQPEYNFGQKFCVLGQSGRSSSFGIRFC